MVSNVNLFCVGVTVVWCVCVLNTWAYVYLEMRCAIVHVEVLACVSVVFCACWGEGVYMSVFLWVFGLFVEAGAVYVLLVVLRVGVSFHVLTSVVWCPVCVVLCCVFASCFACFVSHLVL